MRAVIGVGANLGDRRATIDAAIAKVTSLPGVRSHVVSSLWETDPVGGPPQPPFLNGAVLVEIEPPRSPRSLVSVLLAIEHELGRVRGPERNTPRTIDLDLLWTDGAPSDHPDALVPHPRLSERAFALAPLVELVPDARDRDGVRYADHLARVDRSGIRPARA